MPQNVHFIMYKCKLLCQLFSIYVMIVTQLTVLATVDI